MRAQWHQVALLWQKETRLVIALMLLAALLLGFGYLAAAVIAGDSFAFDRTIILALRTAGDPANPIGPPWLEGAARDLTALGSHLIVILVMAAVAGYLLLVQRPAAAVLVLVSVLGGIVLSSLLKLGIDRPRPDLVPHAVAVFSASFPSGHAVLSAITYLTAGTLLSPTQARRLRVYFMSIAITVTLVVGLTRIYLGVHYPSDVLAGWCIGAAWALTCGLIASRVRRIAAR